MAHIAEQLRARRENWISVGGYEFCVRRPRELDLAKWSRDSNAEVALRSVVDWRGVTVGDVLGVGDDAPADFDAAAAAEWLGDRLDLLLPIWDETQRLIAAHREAREAAEKN